MSLDLEISRDIPPPSKKRTYQFHMMEVGDAFRIKTKGIRAARTAIWRQNKKGEGRFIIGKHLDDW